MSRGLDHREAHETDADVAQHVDVDAEHRPDTSRRASNAGLARETVRMKAGGTAREPAQQAADRGVQSPTTALPHADKIQRAFGAHDVSGIQAHVGDGSARAMGAQAYATGNHVVFDKEPDLHTAAHEAAHVVQQAQGVNLYGGVGKAGDAYERNADEVADRVVQGKSAEDLLGAPSKGSAPAGAVQMKEAKDAKETHAAPTQAYADQSVIHSVQSHVKLAAARMRAGAANIKSALAAPKSDGAGDDQAMNFIQDQIAAVNSDLENLQNEITHASSVTNGTINVELGSLNGAFHDSWVPALNSVYSRTHDANLDLLPQYQGYNLTVGATIDRLRFLYQAAGVDPANLQTQVGPRITDPAKAVEQRDEELQAAELEALKSSMYSTEVALELVSSDLKVASFDQARVADLTRSVEELVNVLEPIAPSHIGKVAKLPALVAKIQAMQAQIDGMTDDHGKALASKIGTHSTLSVGLRRILAKVGSINAAHKAAAKHR